MGARKKVCCKGAVLLEVLLAVAILAAGLTAVLQAMMAHARAASAASEYVQAVHALGQRMTPEVMARSVNDARDDQGPCLSDSDKFQCSMTLMGTVPSPHPQIVFQDFQTQVLWVSGKTDRSFKAAVYLPKVME